MNPDKAKDNLIVRLSFDFGLAIMLFCDKLYEHRRFVIANQLLRAALSIGANVREAQSAESVPDFIHKMKISSKEGEESEFYLQLIEKAYPYNQTARLLEDVGRINKILNKIIGTTKNKL